MHTVHCYLLPRLHETATRVWITTVDEVPVGFIQVDNNDVIDVLYVEQPHRGRDKGVADLLVTTAKAAVPGLCHDGKQSESGEKVVKRHEIPAQPGVTLVRWSEKEAEDKGALAWRAIREGRGL